MVDRRNKEYLPVSVILVTTDRDVSALKSEMRKRSIEDDGLTGVYYAGTPLQGSKVYPLGGVIGPDGSPAKKSPSSLKTMNDSDFGELPISKDSLDDPMVLKAWWYLSNNVYEAYPSIAKAAKKKTPTGEQATLLLERVDAYLGEQALAIIDSGIADMPTYEKAERLHEAIDDAKIKTLKEVNKGLKDLLKEAGKDAGLKDELKARMAYDKLMAMLSSNKAKEMKQAKEGMAQLASLLPDTHYGKLADLRCKTF